MTVLQKKKLSMEDGERKDGLDRQHHGVNSIRTLSLTPSCNTMVEERKERQLLLSELPHPRPGSRHTQNVKSDSTIACSIIWRQHILHYQNTHPQQSRVLSSYRATSNFTFNITCNKNPKQA